MSLVEHARRELDLIENDEEFKQCIINAVEAFAAYGHSGGSASVGIQILHDLLQFKNLVPLTDDPKEWTRVASDMWQSSRNSEAFSSNGGKTYYLLSEGGSHLNQSPLHESEKVG